MGANGVCANEHSARGGGQGRGTATRPSNPQGPKKGVEAPTGGKAAGQGPRNAAGEEPTRTVALGAWIQRTRGKNGRVRSKVTDDDEPAKEHGAEPQQGAGVGAKEDSEHGGIEDEEMESGVDEDKRCHPPSSDSGPHECFGVCRECIIVVMSTRVHIRRAWV